MKGRRSPRAWSQRRWAVPADHRSCTVAWETNQDTKGLMDGNDKHTGPLQSVAPNLLKVVPPQVTSLLNLLTAFKIFSLMQSQKTWDHAVDLLPNFEFNRELFCFPKRNKLDLNIHTNFLKVREANARELDSSEKELLPGWGVWKKQRTKPTKERKDYLHHHEMQY